MDVPERTRTWIGISRTALCANVSALRSLLAPSTALCAVVKSNAYGHGVAKILPILVGEGVNIFGVDSIDEALVVRRANNSATIFVLGWTPTDRYAEAIAERIVVTVVDEESLLELESAAKASRAQALVNIECETGLHRLGADRRMRERMLFVLRRGEKMLTPVSISSHFACAEDPVHPMNVEQETAFAAIVDNLASAGITPTFTHIACSAAAMLAPTTQRTMTRFGIALYGLWSSPELRRTMVLGKQGLDLQPVLSFYTHIAQVKDLPSGEAVGYGARFVANHPMRIAVIPVGYFDGYDRRLSGNAVALVRGHVCAVLGTVCMNMSMIDVSNVPNAKAGDLVTLIGRDGMHTVSADDLALRMRTINYEVVTRLNPSIPRIVW